MYHRGFQVVVLLFFVIFRSESIGIDDKLDFGPTSSHTSFRNYDIGRRNSYELPAKHRNVITKVETTDNFDQLGIVCVEGGCNTTKSINDSGNSVKTDVLVHIETKVDLDRNKTEPIGETPDVPIVVGYKGAKLDRTNDTPGSNTQPVFIPSSNPPYSQRPTHSSGSDFNRPLGGQLYQSGYHQSDAAFNRPPIMSIYGQVYSPNTQSYYPVSDLLFDPPSTSMNRRIDSGGYNYHLQSDSMFNTNPNVNINIKTLPPVSIGLDDNTQSNMVNTRYMPSGIELAVPYFEPSHHSHHFGEHPPPQYVYSHKKPSSFNPVEFKTTKSTWSPSTFYQQLSPPRHTVTPLDGGVKCVCQNGRALPDMQWYPYMNRRVSGGGSNLGFKNTHGDPGSQINDKLAPLN